MATEKQIQYYISLCEQLGQDADLDEAEEMSNKEMSEAIKELKSMLKERNGR